jgi:N-acetylmuramoyl-L-alanine amidase
MIDTSHLSDIQVLACTLYGEARSEPTEGILAVACVIRNRVKADLGNDGKPDWWGEGYRGVCLAKSQFSCWSPVGGEGNYKKLEGLVQNLKAASISDARFKECAWIATGIVNDWGRDITNGADHYHVAGMTPRPDWAQRVYPIKQVARHVFYRLMPKKAA